MNQAILNLKFDTTAPDNGQGGNGESGDGKGKAAQKKGPVASAVHSMAAKMGINSDAAAAKLKVFNNKFLKGTLGLNFSAGAILKQSQIFTSSIGVIFQLLGALVDVMLAPLIPLLIPAIDALSRFIPVMAKWADAVLTPMVNGILFTFGAAYGSIKETYAEVKAIYTKGKEIYDWLENALGSSSTRMQGWVVQGLIGWGKTAFGGNLLVGLAKGAWGMIKFAFTALPKMLGFLIKWGINIGVPYVGKLITSSWEWAMKQIGTLFNWIVNGIKGIFGTAMTWIFDKVLATLGKIKFMGIGEQITKAAKSVTAKGGVGGLIKMMAKSTKAIPVLGAVATAGFGIAETVTAYKEGGMDAALATAVKTVVATTLTATGNSMAGMLVDVVGTQAIKKGLYENGNGGDVNVTVINQNKDGTEQDRETNSVAYDRNRRRSEGLEVLNEIGG
jgi:hypothetical protein